jgi:hypothetical protein
MGTKLEGFVTGRLKACPTCAAYERIRIISRLNRTGHDWVVWDENKT